MYDKTTMGQKEVVARILSRSCVTSAKNVLHRSETVKSYSLKEDKHPRGKKNSNIKKKKTKMNFQKGSKILNESSKTSKDPLSHS